MDIIRINTYKDNRFSERVLLQHGCFLADNKPYEVEIISDYEAVVRGENKTLYPEIIEEFRFFTPHITKFFHATGELIKEYSQVQLLTIPLSQIQPSQFFVDENKIAAISTFIENPQDIIIQVLPHDGRYISLDGHTRLYYAVENGWDCVRAVVESSNEWVFRFVSEANKRGIYTPQDMMRISHGEYEEKWNRFCEEFFAKEES